MPGPSSSNRFKREREQSSDLYSIDDSPLAPAKRQRAQSIEVIVPKSLRNIYEHLLPKPESGIKFLYGATFASTLKPTASRVAVEYRVTEDEAVEEFRRLLAIKAFTSDEKASKISPTPLMDQLWHAAILDTQFYASLQEALGVVMHHRPEGASDKEAEQRAKRLSVMEGIYKTFFSTNPLERRPPTPPASPPQPAPNNLVEHRSDCIRFVVIANGGQIECQARREAKLSSIMKTVADRLQISRNAFRMMYDGNRVDGRHTMASLDVCDGDIFEVHREQCGC